MTITEAVRQVMALKVKPMTPLEAYKAIVEASLFEFKAKSPASVVRSQIRRHCVGLASRDVAAKLYFRQVDNDHYALVDTTR